MSEDQIPQLTAVVFESKYRSASLKRSLESLSFCDEIYVCIPSLDDDRIKTIQKYGCKPFLTEDKTPAECLEGLKNSGAEWTLVLDDREWVDETLASEIRTTIDSGSCKSYSINRTEFFGSDDVTVFMPEVSPVSLIHVQDAKIREKAGFHYLVESSDAGHLTSNINREVFSDFTDCVSWVDRETDRMVKQWKRFGKPKSVFGSLFKSKQVFFSSYFFKGARKLGVKGLFLSVNLAIMWFIGAVKYREMILGPAKVPN